MKAKHRTSEKQAYRWFWLARFLNETAQAAERKRVLELLEKMQRFEAMCVKERMAPAQEPHNFGFSRVITNFGSEAELLLGEINQVLARYPTTRAIRGALADSKGLFLRPQNVRHSYDPAREPWHVTESDAVQMLGDMADDGTIDLLKECGWCKRWFKGNAKKKYCSVPCRRSHHGSSEEFKAARREYMRNNYRLHKERSQRKIATRKELP